ncbi:MAG: DUF3426 domain-containing protein [Alphaproteobacteria bacterium]|nr:DUF3426 domain-containing protein [Alphaproteobacteria bacterium]
MAATLAWAFLGIVVVVVAGGIVLFRDHVVAALPAAAPIYAAVGLMEDPHAGLELRRVTSREISRNGARVLMVEGEVANNTAKQREVPRMRGRLFDERDGELRNWTFSVPDPRLSPGENTRFLTELENPPAGAVRLTILFDAP